MRCFQRWAPSLLNLEANNWFFAMGQDGYYSFSWLFKRKIHPENQTVFTVQIIHLPRFLETGRVLKCSMPEVNLNSLKIQKNISNSALLSTHGLQKFVCRHSDFSKGQKPLVQSLRTSWNDYIYTSFLIVGKWHNAFPKWQEWADSKHLNRAHTCA